MGKRPRLEGLQETAATSTGCSADPKAAVTSSATATLAPAQPGPSSNDVAPGHTAAADARRGLRKRAWAQPQQEACGSPLPHTGGRSLGPYMRYTSPGQGAAADASDPSGVSAVVARAGAGRAAAAVAASARSLKAAPHTPVAQGEEEGEEEDAQLMELLEHDYRRQLQLQEQLRQQVQQLQQERLRHQERLQSLQRMAFTRGYDAFDAAALAMLGPPEDGDSSAAAAASAAPARSAALGELDALRPAGWLLPSGVPRWHVAGQQAGAPPGGGGGGGGGDDALGRLWPAAAAGEARSGAPGSWSLMMASTLLGLPRWASGGGAARRGGAGAGALGSLGSVRDALAGMQRAALPPHLLFSDRDFTPDDYEMLCRLDEGVESRRGAPAALVEALPTQVVPAGGLLGEGCERLACAVCLEEYEEGEQLRLLPCSHRFHCACIGRWLVQRAACPVCLRECA